MIKLTDAQIREKILALLYGVWKERGVQVHVSLRELSDALNLDPITIERNAEVLCELGYIKAGPLLCGGMLM